MKQKKLLTMLVLLLMAASGAWAQTEELLTTITPTGKDTYSETTPGVVTVTHDNSDFYGDYGWTWNQAGSVTVEAKDGYTITECVFRQSTRTPFTVSTAPFKAKFVEAHPIEERPEDVKYLCEGTDPFEFMDGVSSIEVYGYVTPTPAASGYSITLDEGTGNKDSQNWEITPKSSELSGGEAVTVKYNGSREVKSVTVVKKAAAAPVDNTFLDWNGTQLVATAMPTTYNTVESASTDVNWEGGTYVVEGDVTINGKIELSGDVNLIIKDGAKLTANKIVGDNNQLYIYGQAQMTGELVVNSSNGDAIRQLSTLGVISAKVTATSSSNASGGIGEIQEFDVYGGSVEAKGTVANSCGIYLPMGGYMNIYGGEVKAEGTGDGDMWGYGIVNEVTMFPVTVTVYGGQLWAGNANKSALNSGIDLQKGDGFTGKIETSNDNVSWNEYDEEAGTLDHKYVRVGY